MSITDDNTIWPQGKTHIQRNPDSGKHLQKPTHQQIFVKVRDVITDDERRPLINYGTISAMTLAAFRMVHQRTVGFTGDDPVIIKNFELLGEVRQQLDEKGNLMQDAEGNDLYLDVPGNPHIPKDLLPLIVQPQPKPAKAA